MGTCESKNMKGQWKQTTLNLNTLIGNKNGSLNGCGKATNLDKKPKAIVKKPKAIVKKPKAIVKKPKVVKPTVPKLPVIPKIKIPKVVKPIVPKLPVIPKIKIPTPIISGPTPPILPLPK